MRRLPTLTPALLVVAGFCGCRSSIPEVDSLTPAFAGRSASELGKLDRGRSLYIAKCSGCHPLYPPARGGAGYWKRWVVAMAPRSKLGQLDRAVLEEYLFAACGPEPRRGPGRERDGDR